MEETAGPSSVVAHVVVVGFHAKLGSIIEFAYPRLRGTVDLRSPRMSDTQDLSFDGDPLGDSNNHWGCLPQVWTHLPQLALPDGIHEQDTDVVYFRLPPDVHCVACFQQESTREDLNCSASAACSDDVASRGLVQKSVVLMAKRPVYGALEEKLRATVRAYFDQGDFSKTNVLVSLFHSVNVSMSRPSHLDAYTLFHGLDLRRLVRILGVDILTLLKLVLLEKRVVVTSQPINIACNAVVTLASIFPGVLDTLSFQATKSETLSDEETRLGHPLSLFGDSGSMILQPYSSLPLLNEMLQVKRKGCLACVSRNVAMLLSSSLGKQSEGSDRKILPTVDVLVDLSSRSTLNMITFPPKTTLRKTVQLSRPERRFGEDLARASTLGDSEKKNSSSGAIAFRASDDYLRARLREYLRGFLRSVLGTPALQSALQAAASVHLSSQDANRRPVFTDANELRALNLTQLSVYHEPFVRTWLWSARSCRAWVSRASSELGELHGPPSPEVDALHTSSMIPELGALTRRGSGQASKWLAKSFASSRAYSEVAHASKQAYNGVRGWIRNIESEITLLDTAFNEAGTSHEGIDTVDITSGATPTPEQTE